MTITLEAIRAAGGIVHSDGNIVFRDISMMQGLAGAAPAAVAPQGEYPHEQMDAMALARYKVVPSHASMLWSHAVVAGHGAQQLYVGREVECQNMARKFAGAFLDGAFAFHSMAAAPTAQAAPALEAPAAPADGATPGPWFVRKREVNGELRDCFVAAPDCQGLAYDACILCDDEYHDGVGRKLADCELIVAAVNQHRAALAAAPQAPAVPVAVTTRAELEKLQGGAGSMATIFPADASGFPVRLYAEPAAPAVDAQAERDTAFEAVRKRLCGLPRYSFVLDDDGVVRREQDRIGNWIEFDDAHELFDPVAVDAAIAAQAAAKGE
ncbi:hypothetical protein [Delftia tsuruhatensis]|uniref:hypothetical protein n=1 Tax=Delftia tsuruhatensis TaxID=180282 RepID=UPI002AD2C4EF|nr:hypothetical protein [Delftia tsuruhatensis]WQM80316.1 hypothetical protein RNT40_16475 [Delftia tsuruhatensis]